MPPTKNQCKLHTRPLRSRHTTGQRTRVTTATRSRPEPRTVADLARELATALAASTVRVPSVQSRSECKSSDIWPRSSQLGAPLEDRATTQAHRSLISANTCITVSCLIMQCIIQKRISHRFPTRPPPARATFICW